MGACTSKSKKNKDKHGKNDATNGTNNSKKASIVEQAQEQRSSSGNVDKFANVPFIDSEEKQTTAPASSSPTVDPSTPLNDNDKDERTTVKTNFESNVSYSCAETIEKLKQEVYSFLREKILPLKDEKGKLIDYVHQRFAGNNIETTEIDQELEQCCHDIEQNQHPDGENSNAIKKRIMNIVTAYVASRSNENSFLRALYEKLGDSLDLNTLNAETTEHEVVNVTVTKTVRQVFIDGSSTIMSELNGPANEAKTNSVIHIDNNEYNIPADLPEDIRLKAEQALNSFNDAIHTSQD